jgi:flavin reductase (DIM6/NTAB) family NADH-FMN oxidoreductase RutF
MGLRHTTPSRDDVRRAIGTFAAGVTIITAFDDTGAPIGVTATAFTSVSFDPPSVLVCLRLQARTQEWIRAQGRFGVNLLGVDSQALSDYCANPGQDKRLPTEWLDASEASSTPCLNGAIAFFDCIVTDTLATGTHVVIIAAVAGVAFSELRDFTDPLLHFRGAYRRLSPLVRGSTPDPLPIVFDDSPIMEALEK